MRLNLIRSSNFRSLRINASKTRESVPQGVIAYSNFLPSTPTIVLFYDFQNRVCNCLRIRLVGHLLYHAPFATWRS